MLKIESIQNGIVIDHIPLEKEWIFTSFWNWTPRNSPLPFCSL